MTSHGFEHILETLLRQPDGRMPDRLCGAARVLLDCDGVALSLPGGGVLTVLGASGVGEIGEHLQRELGEGPTFDALVSGESVEVELPAAARWPVFGPAAVERGLAFVHGLPVQQGGVRLAAMTAYRSLPTPLSDTEHGLALAIARLAGELIVTMQADVPEEELPEQLLRTPTSDWIVHQAAGMVAVQLSLSLIDALARLRAHAFASGLPLDRVASDIIARRLRLEEST